MQMNKNPKSIYNTKEEASNKKQNYKENVLSYDKF